MHRADHLFVLMRPRHRQDARVSFPDDVFFDAETSGDDDAAIFLHRFADRVQRFRLRRIQKAAGIYYDEVCARVLAREFIALGA